MLEALCENDGAAFRSLLAALRANPAPEMQELYQRFLHSPPALIGYQRIADKKTTIYNGFFGYRRRKGNGKVTRPAFHRTRGRKPRDRPRKTTARTLRRTLNKLREEPKGIAGSRGQCR